ncbi:MAG: DUF3090 domain-containing protein [Chloroflexota bacterium]
MPRFELDIDPITHITADAIGKPGQRVFYIQAWQNERTYTIVIEKFQLQSLAIAIEQFLAELIKQNPVMSGTTGDYTEDNMRISPPVEPIFRTGEFGLGYDKERDLVVILAREIVVEDADPEEAGVIRFWCRRDQVHSLARWGAEVSSRGRPICPQCGQPMEAEGHFCPKKNGHLH